MNGIFDWDVTLIESIALITSGTLCFYLACIHSIISEKKNIRDLKYQLKRLHEVEQDKSNEKWTRPFVVKTFKDNIESLRFWHMATALFNLFMVLLGLSLLGYGLLSLVL